MVVIDDTMLNLHYEFGKTVGTKEQFEKYPEYSIAADGFLEAAPYIDSNKHYANFDHHAGVDRSKTKCACAQVFDAIVGGNLESFVKGEEFTANLYVNHADLDIVFTYWLLDNYKYIRELKEKDSLAYDRLEKLIDIEDCFDTNAGFCKRDPESEEMKEAAWVFEPHVTGKYGLKTPEGLIGVTEEVGARILKYIKGSGGKVELKTEYRELYFKKHGEHVIGVFKEIDRYARVALASEVDFAIIINGGRNIQSLGKTSHDVNYPMDELYRALDAADIEKGVPISKTNHWNGSSFGGPPRETGTELTLEEILDLAIDIGERYCG